MPKKSLTQSEVFSELAEATGLKKSEVKAIFEEFVKLVAKKAKSGDDVPIPGVGKIKFVHKAATPARKGINPFTKEPTTFKAKPARKVIKIRPTKALKDVL